MELNKDDIQRYRRSGMNFIGKYGAREPYDSYFVTHIKSLISYESQLSNLGTSILLHAAKRPWLAR